MEAETIRESRDPKEVRELKNFMASMLAIHVRNYTAKRVVIMLAIQTEVATSNSEFTRILRVNSANITADLKWLLENGLIYPLSAEMHLGDMRRQRYHLTRLGYQAVAAITMSKYER